MLIFGFTAKLRAVCVVASDSHFKPSWGSGIVLCRNAEVKVWFVFVASIRRKTKDSAMAFLSKVDYELVFGRVIVEITPFISKTWKKRGFKRRLLAGFWIG